MSFPGKIDPLEMRRLKREGYSQSKIAEFFHVSRAAVSKASQTLSKRVLQATQLDAAHLVIDEHIDALGQLTKLNNTANRLLDVLLRAFEGDLEAIEMIEKQNAIKGHVRNLDLRELLLKTMREISNQINLQRSIFETLVDFKSVQKFQAEIIGIITEDLNEEDRAKIIGRLKSRRLLRGITRFAQ